MFHCGLPLVLLLIGSTAHPEDINAESILSVMTAEALEQNESGYRDRFLAFLKAKPVGSVPDAITAAEILEHASNVMARYRDADCAVFWPKKRPRDPVKQLSRNLAFYGTVASFSPEVAGAWVGYVMNVTGRQRHRMDLKLAKVFHELCYTEGTTVIQAVEPLVAGPLALPD